MVGLRLQIMSCNMDPKNEQEAIMSSRLGLFPWHMCPDLSSINIGNICHVCARPDLTLSEPRNLPTC